MPATDFQERRHVRRLSVEVDGQDRSVRRSDLALDLEDIHCIGDGVHVDEDRGRPDIADRPGGGNKGHRDRDDLVVPATPAANQGQVEGRCSGIDPNAVTGLQVGREGLLELGNPGAQDVGRAFGHVFKGLETSSRIAYWASRSRKGTGSSSGVRPLQDDSWPDHQSLLEDPGSRSLQSRAGTPTTTMPGATSRVTTAPAPTRAPPRS